MPSRRWRISLCLCLAITTGGFARADAPYRPTWESLAKHETPEWLKDAKFGIYTHWGPISLANMHSTRASGWYARSMYNAAQWEFAYHQKHFGDQATVGYKDIIARFKAEDFDAEAWAELFARAGARFAGPVAIHHENYALWDSALTEWDSVDIGPRRDITGALATSIRKRGMKFIATFHHAFAWEYYEHAYQYDAKNPKLAGLYGEVHKPGTAPSKAYLDLWLGKVNEVARKYEPDLIWFDFGLGKLIPPDYQRQMFADYYNWAAGQHRPVDVAHKHRDIHAHTGLLDFERGREDRLTEYVWMTDTAVGPWYYYKNPKYKTVDQLVDVLVDIVSKNGCMLLNVGPDGTGRIDAKAREILHGLGDWLRVNGESIFDTRPWTIFGEGPTKNAGGGFSEHKDKPFGARDIRFTRSKDGKTFHAITLGWPESPLVIRTLRVVKAAPDARVRLLGHAGALTYRTGDDAELVIDLPAHPSGAHAFAFQLTGFDLAVSEAARFEQPETVQLEPNQATLEGKKIKTQVNEDRLNIGFWDDPAERVHWLAWIETPGTYAVRGEFSCAGGPSELQLEVASQKRKAAVPKTRGWFKPVHVTLGRFRIAAPGVYHLMLGPADPTTWKPVNVYGLQIAKMK